MKRSAVLVLAMLVAAPAMATEPGLLEKAKAEKKVAFYANITAVEPIVEAFSKNYGIQAEYTRVSTSKFVSTVLTEHQAGKLMADVLQAPVPILQLLKEKGVLAPYKSPALSGYPEWARKDDTIIIFGIEYVGLIYNRELVKPQDVPKRYQDLADPKWKDKIVMADPSSHATTISWLVGLKETVFSSEQAWLDFVKGLAANRPMFVASFGPTPSPVETGQKLIAISMPKYVITKAPAPLDWAKLEQPLLGTPRAMALTAKAPHPHAARLFVDYWLSEESMKTMAQKVGEYVLLKDIYPPLEGIQKVKVEAIRELSDEEISRWGAEFRRLFALP